MDLYTELMPVILRQSEPGGPHIDGEALLSEALAVPELQARAIAFTYYRDSRLLLVETDRVLTVDEIASVDAVLEAHQGRP